MDCAIETDTIRVPFACRVCREKVKPLAADKRSCATQTGGTKQLLQLDFWIDRHAECESICAAQHGSGRRRPLRWDKAGDLKAIFPFAV